MELGGAAGLVYISFHGTYVSERERERLGEKVRGRKSREDEKTVLMG